MSSMPASSGFSISWAMRDASSRATTSAGSISCSVIVSQAMLAMRAARLGTMPCQPRNGLTPMNSTGWNIIRIATSLVP
jgi:hypothetical protein